MNSLSLALIATLSAAPLAVWADANPDFDDDAKPILRMQPGLLQYVEHTYEVKDTGTAKHPGDDDRRPEPPYIFRARPMGSHGAYNLRLLIQPGASGHILGVVDMTKVHLNVPPDRPFGSAPAVASRAPITPQVPQAPQPPATPNVQVPELSAGPVDQQASAAPQAPAAPQTPPAPEAPAAPNEPTADTPSGPITDSSSPAPAAPSAPATPSLTPPPDPAPPAP